ncbi:protein of unknown function [Azospirillum lipoferum 4B]|uniref:Uncharacterized protein n=1 Tax=Azospirillum lipoferum (strain 4B) TaxID=862719 RepID=G7Z7V2_AZOL4|nr:protein of unknown function [Azospirillum lipoferum 4B]
MLSVRKDRGTVRCNSMFDETVAFRGKIGSTDNLSAEGLRLDRCHLYGTGNDSIARMCSVADIMLMMKLG